MRKLSTILFILPLLCNATNWYVDNTAGGTNSGTLANPWTSLASINWTSIAAGDSLLLKRGDIFNEKFTIGKSGSSGSPIIISAYSTGANPIISGFTSVSSWTNVSGNIWESSSAITTSANMLNMVTVNGTFQAIGRYPKVTASNGGWLTITSHTWSGGSAPWTGSVTGVLAGTTDYTGGEVIMRTEHWIIDRATITSQSYSGGSITVNFTEQRGWFGSTGYQPQNNFGFFMQNDADACTAQGDWYYNTSTKKIGMYSVGTPSNVKVATIDTLVSENGQSYVNMYGLDFTGANMSLFDMAGSGTTNWIIDHCNFSYSGVQGITIDNNSANNNTVQYCTFNQIGSRAISGANTTYFTVQHNKVSNINMIAGMGQGGDGDGFPVYVSGANGLVQYNELYNLGLAGIVYNGANTVVRYNYIHDFCKIKDDQAAIYSSDGGTPGSFSTYRQVYNNICINGGRNLDTTGAPSPEQVVGIYLDIRASYANVYNNTVASVGGNGFRINGGTYDTIKNNTFYDNDIANYVGTTPQDGTLPGNIIVKKNNSVAKKSNQLLWANINASANPSVSTWGVFDSNYLCRPINETNNIQQGCNGYTYAEHGGMFQENRSGTITEYSTDKWITYSGLETNSKTSPKTVSSTDSILFVYNPTDHDSTVSLNAKTYFGVDSTVYESGSITLSAYTSKVLIYRSEMSVLPINDRQMRYLRPTIRFTHNNPVHDYLNMQMPSDRKQNIALSLFDIYGRELLKKKISLFRGANELSVDMSRLASGVYILKMENNYDAIKYFKILKLQ